MPIINGIHCCLQCKEKEIIRDFTFSGSHWFCSQECLDTYIDSHPGTMFKTSTPKVEDRKYCPKCHKIMKKFYDVFTNTDYFKCKDCGDD